MYCHRKKKKIGNYFIFWLSKIILNLVSPENKSTFCKLEKFKRRKSVPNYIANLTKYIYIYLYTNTVLEGSVIMCVCSFAVETTFPLSNFKTKHTFGIFMALRKFVKLFIFIFLLPPQFWGNQGTPIFILYFEQKRHRRRTEGVAVGGALP